MREPGEPKVELSKTQQLIKGALNILNQKLEASLKEQDMEGQLPQGVEDQRATPEAS